MTARKHEVVPAANTVPFEARAGQRSLVRLVDPDRRGCILKDERVRRQRRSGSPLLGPPLPRYFRSLEKATGRSTSLAVHTSGVRSGILSRLSDPEDLPGLGIPQPRSSQRAEFGRN